MKTVKRLTVALLALVVSVFAFCFVACDEETPTPPPAPEVSISVEIGGGSLIYSGAAQTPTVTVKNGETALTEGTDYDLAYSDNTNAGTGKVTVTFKGEYEGEEKVEKTFTIAKAKVDKPAATATAFTYDGTEKTYATVAADAKYTIANEKRTNAGTQTVTYALKDKANYAWADGTADDITYDFMIAKANAAAATVTVADIVYGQTPTASVALDGFTLTSADYEVALGDYSAVSDSVTATVTFKGNFEGSASTTYAVKPIQVNPQITLSAGPYEYNGEEIEPTVTVKDENLALIDAAYYDVAYLNNVFAGEAKAVVTLKGIYAGSAEKSFTIDKKKIDKPAADTTSFVYDGSVQEYELAESDFYEVTGNLQSEKGNYTVKAVLVDGDNYSWSDGTTNDLTFEFNIAAYDVTGKAILTVNDVVEGVVPEGGVELAGFVLESGDYEIAYGDYNTVSNAVTATASFSGNFTGSATAVYKVKSISEGVDVLMDFNYDIVDRASGRETLMQGSVPVESYAAAASNTGGINLTSGRKTFVQVKNTPLGTDDFTISLNAKFDMADVPSGTNEGNALFETGLHIAYDCTGNKCSTTNCPSTHKDVVKLSLSSRSANNYEFRFQFGDNAVKVNGIYYELSADEIKQLVENGESKWFNVTFGVDRKTSINGDIETAVGFLYLNGNLLATKPVEFEIDNGNYYLLGDGNIYLGGNNTWSSAKMTERDRSIDNFVLYKGVLNERQIKDILPAYVAANDAKTDWGANAVGFNFFDLAEYEGVQYAFEKDITFVGTTPKDEITLKTAPSGITLIENAGSYKLAFETSGIESATDGINLTLTRNGIDKKLFVCYTALDEISVSNDIVIYDFEAVGSITKKFTVKAGNVGLEGVNFTGDFASKITPTATAGEYALTLTATEVSEITAPVTITATFEGLSDTFTVSLMSSLVVDDTAYNSSNATAASPVKKNITLGTDSFTVGFNLTMPPLANIVVGTSGTANHELFSNQTTRGGEASGFSIWMKSKQADNYQFGVRIGNGTTYWVDRNGLQNYHQKTASVVVVFDRTGGTVVKVRCYVNGVQIDDVDTSATTGESIAATTALDSAVTGNGLVFGGTNNSPVSSFSKGFEFENIYVTKGICNDVMSAALMAKNA